jgi:lipoyl synthase
MRIREQRHPKWMKVQLPAGKNFRDIRQLVRQQQLNTVCESAHCPNIGECWNNRTATFMILGDVCTRNCRFCAVTTGTPGPIDFHEPERVAYAVEKMNLKYAVITSVTRDDLNDGGATIFSQTIFQIKQRVDNCQIEVLIPDFQGNRTALDIVIHAQPTIINHNLETVPRLYHVVRPQADYQQSLHIIRYAHQAGIITKSGLMLGLGEVPDEVEAVMHDLLNAGCNILTLGQYLQPSSAHLPIVRYISPEEFDILKNRALDMGISHVEAGPLVRSSYHAALHDQKALSNK